MNQKLQILKKMDEKSIEYVSPEVDPRAEIGFHYPDIEPLIDEDNPREILEEMSDQYLLYRYFYERIHLCPSCNRYNLNFREVCPECHTSNIDLVDVLHHYACANVDAESEYDQDGELVCPKCNETLRHIGVDYERTGESYRCNKCGDISQEPPVFCQCLICDESFHSSEAEELKIYQYEITTRGEQAIEQGKINPQDEGSPMFDSETSFYSSVMFHELLNNKVSEVSRYGAELTVMYMDYQLTQTHSRDKDRFLRYLKRAMLSILRSSDYPAIDENDRFMAILTETNLEDAYVPSKRIISIIENVDELSPADFQLSVGLAEFREGHTDQELLNRAQADAREAMELGTPIIPIDQRENTLSDVE